MPVGSQNLTPKTYSLKHNLGMNSTLINSNPDFNQPNASHASSFLKALVFSIGTLHLALRVELVYKVLNAAPIYGSGINGVGITHMGDREVTVLDLQQRLFQSNRTTETTPGNFLVVVQNSAGDFYGFPVEIVPVLMDIPLTSIRVLPESFRHADSLGIASHVAVISQEETPLTLFLLDVDSATK
jgi:chemotaxis signal transduction protein